jgi:hypothetical protein
MMRCSCLALVALAGLCGCAPVPYLRIEGAVTSTLVTSRPLFDAQGLRVNITGLTCRVSVVENWCPVNEPKCRRDPIVTRDDPVACPHNVMSSEFSLHTPWGGVYPSTFAAGLLDIKVDWSSVVVDSLDGVMLRTGWLLQGDDGVVNVGAPLVLTDEEVRSLLAVIRSATGNDYSEAPVGQRAALTVTLSNEPSADDESHIVVSVTNHGPAPAYRVVAQLKSRATELPGVKLSFGRIDRAETKKRAKNIATSRDHDDVIEVEVTSPNAATTSSPDVIRLKHKRKAPESPESPPPPPRLLCSSPTKQATAGHRVRVLCEISNPGDKPVKGVGYKVSVGGAAPVPASGPTDLAPHAPSSKFDVDVSAPVNTSPGPVTVTVTAKAPETSSVQQDVAFDVVEPHKLCTPGELTIDDYHRKHKALDEERNDGHITKEELNDYLSELWGCVRQTPR